MSQDPELLAAMRRAPLLCNVKPEMAASLLHASQTLRFEPGRTIFTPMHRAERFFLVLVGRVRIYKVSPRGDEQTLHLYGPGDTFGEAAMLARGEYPAYASAIEDTRLLAVGRATLAAAIAREPELAMGMMAGLSGKLREFARLIEELSLKEVPARLAGVLLAERARAGCDRFRLSQTKRQLASQIGTVAETLSRAFAKLRAAGAIEVKGSEIRVLDAAMLESLTG